MDVSVLILTLNEERNLPGCLDSVAWCDDVVVFDSYSTDATTALAEARGARVVQRTFDHYAAQRNAALHEVAYAHPWVLMIDADERVPPALRAEIARTLPHTPPEVTLYRMRRKDMFMGRWLRRSSGYPSWFYRLCRPERLTVERAINEEYYTDGELRDLDAHLVHYPFNKGIAYWLDRHNRYSTMEAETLLREQQALPSLGDLLASDPSTQRRALKQLAYRLPLRPLVAFLYLYVVRGGFLDGLPGFTYCTLRGIYEYMIDLKMRELARRRAGEPL